MKSSLRKLTNAVLLVGLGAAAYLALPTLQRLLDGEDSRRGQLTELPGNPLAQVEVEGASGDNAGNVVLHNCLIALERRGSIQVDLLQTGAITDQRIETSGGYLQKGRGEDRQFSLLLQGRIGDATSRIWQVSDGRFLFTDLAWDDLRSAPQLAMAFGAESTERRTVNRVDLAAVRRRLDKLEENNQLAPGRGQAELLRPGFWAGHGGLPMLVGALGENFDFGTPRQMSLRNEPVYAMIGRWKPARRDALLTPPVDPNRPADAPPPEPVAMPDRMPHHLLIAIGVQDLFPRLIEYRNQHDELSAPALADDDRFRESQQPLMRMDFLSPQFDRPISDEHFAYREPEGINFRDATDSRLRLVDRRRIDSTAGVRRR